MRVDALFRSAGLDQADPGPADAERIREVLLTEAETFLRAGGVLTFRDWRKLGGASRAAFVAARARLDGSVATSGPSAAPRGPQALVERALEDAVADLEKELAA